MATSVESSPPSTLLKESTSLMRLSNTVSPSSDKQFWSTLRNRIDTILENRKPVDQMLPLQPNEERSKRLKEDSLLLLRGFDSVAYSLSQLSNNLDNALQGAKDLAGTPTLTEIVETTLEEKQKDEEDIGEINRRGLKRKLDSPGCSSDEQGEKIPAELAKLTKAKNIAISMAKRAASLAREMQSIKSDLCFMQERCTLLEEENRKLRDGVVVKGIQPEEDDLVRLQLEALLAEKSRLANENANLKRENQCLNQLVEYHQITSQDLSESYEYDDVIRGLCLDFSSPQRSIPEEDEVETPETPMSPIYGVSASLDDRYDQGQE